MLSLRSRRAKVLLLSSSFALIAYLIRRYRRYVILKKRRAAAAAQPQETTSTQRALNKQFFHQIRELLKILIPSVRSDSFLILITHLTTLITRTFLVIYIAHLDGAIVKSLVQRSPGDFVRNIGYFIAVAVPASFINSFIRFAESKLALSLRTRLSRHAYEAYFRV